MGLRKPADGPENLLHRRSLAKNLRRERRFLSDTLLIRALLDRTADKAHRLVDIKGFGKIFERSALEGCHCAVEIRVCRHYDHGQLRVRGLHLLEQLEP